MPELVFKKAPSATVTTTGYHMKRGSSLIASGLSGAESIAVNVKVGDVFEPAKDSTGTNVALTATTPQYSITANAYYQVVVPTTTNAVTVLANDA